MIRLVRTLRFLRVLKLLRRARTVDTVMARRHVSRAASLAVCTAVCALLLSSLLAPESGAGGTEAAWDARQARTAARLVEAGPDPAALSRALGALQESEGSLLLVRLEGRPLFARHEDGYFRRYFAPGDYAYLRKEALEIFFDERPLSRGQARESLPFHLLVLLLALAFLLLYGPHFAWTVCDPLRVMRRGLRETGHGRPVEIPERYREDEVFLLARAYNERCLPAREGEGARANGSLPDLDDDDIKNLLERESR